MTAIPTPDQIRRIRPTSVDAFRKELKKAGLNVVYGGAHLRIETADGMFVSTMPLTPGGEYAGRRALLNCRSHIVRRLTEIHAEAAESTRRAS